MTRILISLKIHCSFQPYLISKLGKISLVTSSKWMSKIFQMLKDYQDSIDLDKTNVNDDGVLINGLSMR